MTPQQLQAIKEHGRNLLAIFPDATEKDPVKLCKKLRRIEAKAHRAADDVMRASNLHLHQDWGGYGIIAPEIGPDGQN